MMVKVCVHAEAEQGMIGPGRLWYERSRRTKQSEGQRKIHGWEELRCLVTVSFATVFEFAIYTFTMNCHAGSRGKYSMI